MKNKDNRVDVCVLLATYRRPQLLDQTLRSLADQRLDNLSLRVIIADNASDRTTADVVQSQRSQTAMHYVPANERRGKSAALNIALARVPSCELLVLTDDDIIADAGWIRELWAASRRWPEADVFGGRIEPHYPATSQPENVSDTWLRVAFGVKNEDGAERLVPSDRLWGTNLAVRARALSDDIRFDERLGPAQGDYATGCETDFTARLVQRGAVCVFVPTAIVRHVVRDEQLTPHWLCQRAYKHGRGTAAKTPAEGQHPVWGVPRWVYRRRAEWLFRRWSRSILGNRAELLQAQMESEFLRGLMSYYREQDAERRQSNLRH